MVIMIGAGELPLDVKTCQNCEEDYSWETTTREQMDSTHTGSSTTSTSAIDMFRRDPHLPVQSRVCRHVACYGCIRKTKMPIDCFQCGEGDAFHIEHPFPPHAHITWLQLYHAQQEKGMNHGSLGPDMNTDMDMDSQTVITSIDTSIDTGTGTDTGTGREDVLSATGVSGSSGEQADRACGSPELSLKRESALLDGNNPQEASKKSRQSEVETKLVTNNVAAAPYNHQSTNYANTNSVLQPSSLLVLKQEDSVSLVDNSPEEASRRAHQSGTDVVVAAAAAVAPSNQSTNDVNTNGVLQPASVLVLKQEDAVSIVDNNPEEAPERARQSGTDEAVDPKTFYKGKKVAKMFENEIYFGTVTRYRPRFRFWVVEYDDGDDEEFDKNDLMNALNLYESNQHTSAASQTLPECEETSNRVSALCVHLIHNECL